MRHATALKAWPRGLRPLCCSLDSARNDSKNRLHALHGHSNVSKKAPHPKFIDASERRAE